MYTEEINKVAWDSNDDKRLQTLDRVTTYPYGTINETLKTFEAKETLKMWKVKMYANQKMFLKYVKVIIND